MSLLRHHQLLMSARAQTQESSYIVYGVRSTPRIIINDTASFGGTNLFTGAVPSSPCYDTAYSPDGAMLAACFENSEVHIYNTATWATITSFSVSGMTGGGLSIDWSPDGNYLAVVGLGAQRVALYAVSGWSRITTTTIFTNTNGVEFGVNSDYFLVSYQAATGASRYDVPSGAGPTILGATYAGTTRTCVAINKPQGYALFGGTTAANNIKCIRLSDFVEVPAPVTAPTAVNSISFNPAGTLCCILYNQSPAYGAVYDTATWTVVHYLSGVTSTGTRCRFSNNGKWLAVGWGANPGAYVIDTTTWSIITPVPPIDGVVQSVRFSPN